MQDVVDIQQLFRVVAGHFQWNRAELVEVEPGAENENRQHEQVPPVQLQQEMTSPEKARGLLPDFCPNRPIFFALPESP